MNSIKKATNHIKRRSQNDRGGIDVGLLLALALVAAFLVTGVSKAPGAAGGFAASYCGNERHFGLEGERPGCPEGSNQPAVAPVDSSEIAAGSASRDLPAGE